ncbi:hypothetical protein CYD26_19155 [Pseudomonas sp. FFUP_PS_473]|uniref:hypothetical protein n=1 Tax=Pseudomonas TaxID=286 RepID=UPI000C7ABC96|nr:MULTISPECIES: hypothetical protein [Pseudomonas]PLP88531.1 hypothetical protein CYD26_19155 [Pseudomonas sp. FFUP_PS_473]
MSIWTGLKRTVAVLGSAAEAVSRALTVLNDFLDDVNRSSAEFNRSLKERLEAGRTPALETQVKVLEAQIAHPEIFSVLPRQVMAKRKELLQVYEELAGRLTGEAADEVLVKRDKLRAELREKTAR